MLSLLLMIDPASACGGFFCNSVDPVVQKAERIVFVVDPVGVVETHVQVEFEGQASEFAWIVPVQAQPELFLSNDMLFNMVATQLQPVWGLAWQEEGHCKNPFNIGLPWGSQEMSFSSAGGDSDGSNGIDVVDQATVGPYDTVTLQAETIEGLMQWLSDNGYAIPSTAADAIAPYISSDGYFVALKLSKGLEIGDLRPLGVRYQGDRPAVPIQLTSVAAADDMRLEVTVFSDKRAVPESYLHVEVNHAAIDWFSGGSNYQDVITRAADEAGGHAFATDYAGPTSILFPNFASTTNVDSLRRATSATAWIEGLQGLGFFGSADILALFQEVAPVRPGLVQIDVYNCPSCFDDWFGGDGFDADIATDRLIELVIEPREAVEGLLNRFDYVTRLTSSLSASEMTIDPTFTFTDAMGEVELIRTATLHFECNGKYFRRAPRRLELSNGHTIEIPSQRELERKGLTESEYLAELGSINALKIERTSSEGSVLIADFTSDVAAQIDSFNSTRAGGCGCSNNPIGILPSMFVGLTLLFGLRRRR